MPFSCHLWSVMLRYGNEFLRAVWGLNFCTRIESFTSSRLVYVQKVLGSADRKAQKRQGESRNHLLGMAPYDIKWMRKSLCLEVCGFSAVINNPYQYKNI
jgi:hypothetical protein